MLGWQKKDITEITNVLSLAHDKMRKAIMLSRFDIISELSAVCIEYAENIKIKVSDDGIINAVLEYISVAKSPNTTDSEFLTLLDEKLTTLINVIDDTPVKKEILFLPYNASMWDSFHTVYLAAKADESCEVFVVPIPYYNIVLSAQSLGELHHEINEFPKDVIVTHYDDYNLEKRAPDMIFIHNPYDYQNNITRITERFYCMNLRKYTKMLIYIPYFVADNYIETKSAVVQGVLLADKVIVNSNNERKLYIDILLQNREDIERYMKRVCDKKYFEDKFVVIGSPKLELAAKSKREDFDIPENWLKKIQNPDGSYKKVLFYNTSISSVLVYSSNHEEKEENDRYFSHLENVFDVFRKREDIVLWWRPHPLFFDTILSLRPIHYNRYRNIVDKFIADDFGIYDDTSDLHRAIAWSDAYYGDASSVVPMFTINTKPILYQNPSIQSIAHEKLTFDHFLRFDSLIATDDYFYVASINYNSLFQVDKASLTAKHLRFFPNEDILKPRLYFAYTAVKDKLYFAPLSADSLALYSIKSNRFTVIPLPAAKNKFAKKIPYNKDIKFSQIFHYDKYIFLTPSTYPGIIRYNIDNGEITVYTAWVKEIKMQQKDSVSAYFSRGIITDNKIFLACASMSAVFEFDMSTGLHQVHKIQSENIGYQGICFDGNDYWLLPITAGGPVVRWNRNTFSVNEYDRIISDVYCPVKYYPFQNIRYANGYVWILPAFGDLALKIDIKDGSVYKADYFQEEIYSAYPDGEKTSKYIFFLEEMIDNTLYAFSDYSDQFFAYDTITGKTRTEKIKIEDDSYDKIAGELICTLYNDYLADTQAYKGIFDDEQLLLKVFSDNIDSLSKLIKPNPKHSSNVGQKIYKKAKQFLALQQ
jgi:hypothetical protein